MAKAVRPGAVKTRLIADGLTPDAAAGVHEAMLSCVVARLDRLLPRSWSRVLAVGDPDWVGMDAPADAEASLRVEADRVGAAPDRWRVMPQGTGGLGDRLERIGVALGDRPVAFFGVDSPDVPAEALERLFAWLGNASESARLGIALGPTDDGGYWTLAAHRPRPAVLRGVDWGSERVYAQTLERAAAAGLAVTALHRWYDVDDVRDLAGLRSRLERASEPELLVLGNRLAELA